MSEPDVTLEALRGTDIAPALDALAQLRCAVFREWPYLYEGSPDYERAYLAPYASAPGALVVAAYANGAMVGAATATPMEDHAADFSAALEGHDLSQIYYCAESVLAPAYRGRGLGHRFFDLREAEAQRLGRRHVAFCAVVRPASHPARPDNPRDLSSFWRGRGYAPLPGAVAKFAWTDIGNTGETHKPLQFWMKTLP